MTPEEIKNRINLLAAKRTPFLFAVDFELSEGICIENPTSQDTVLFRTPLGTNSEGGDGKIEGVDSSIEALPESYERYHKRFTIVMNALKRGDSFLANLTVSTPVNTDLSLKEIFFHSNTPYALYIPDRFVCFSPERFVRISEGRISTNPMKGTINAAIPDAEQIILTDEKETAEHNTIVDLLRNDLGMVACNIQVDRFRYIDHICTPQRNILQVSSEISGQLADDYLSSLGDIVFKMLPAGSVSGAPKKTTVRAIQCAEGKPRGYYTGVFGYFDGVELDSAVLIRYIEEVDGKKYFRSGGGITVFSDPQKEYNEIVEKIYLPFT